MKRIREIYHKNLLAIDFVGCCFAFTAIVAFISYYPGKVVIMDAFHGNHQALYTAIASVSGSMLGFIISAVSIMVVVGQFPETRVLRDSGEIRGIYRAYFQAILWLGIATAWAFVGLLFDTDRTPRLFIASIMLLGCMIATARVYRCVWILRTITSELSKAQARAAPSKPIA